MKTSQKLECFFEPQGLGVCSVALSWDDTDDGWNKAEKAFENYNEEKVLEIVNKVPEQLN